MTSPYGSQAAARLETREFVALRIHLNPDSGFHESSLGPKGLFIVSPHKPRAPFEDFCLPLTGDSTKALTLNHSLPSDGGTLYIHTFPLIYETEDESDESANSPIEPSFYQLDTESYRRLLAYYRDFRPPVMPMRLSGGPEVVGARWETFSGRNRYEIEKPDISFSFEISPLKYLPLHSTADVWMELLVLQRLREEYSWQGVTRTVNWLCELRRWSGPIKPFTACARPFKGSIPSLDSDAYHELYRRLVPVDAESDSPQLKPVEDEDEFDDEEDWIPSAPEFATVPRFTTVIPDANRLRVVVIDICGAVFNFVSSSRNALLQLGIPEAYVDSWVMRLREIQALENDAQSPTYIDACRRALFTVAKSLPRVSHSQFETAVRTLIRPGLLPGILEALSALRSSGLAAFGYSVLDATTTEAILGQLTPALPLHMLPSFGEAPGLFSPCTEDHMQLLLGHVRDRSAPGIEPDQIVVVSPSSVRVLEPATAAGMATALLALPEHPEVNALGQHYTVESTMVLQLYNLAATICTPSSWKRSTPSTTSQWVERVRGIYELLDPLQSSPNGATVSVAITWVVNELVAIKYELSPGGHSALSAVHYEACVYKQLADSIAIPRMHWSGFDGGAEVLVLDLLGPTLENLRLACRGTLSLKSVLMIGIQMLDFIEFAHSRGVIIRDIKPQNSAIGRAPELAGTIFNFDFGNAKAYADPHTGTHIPLRSGRKITGTVRFCSHWSHQGLECSRRDDIMALGHTLLYLLYGKLPWQGIYAPTHEAKLQRIGEMKELRHPALAGLLAQSPAALSGLMTYAHGLGFAQKPDYVALRVLLEREMYERRWLNDSLFDWIRPELASSIGTLIPWEYGFAYDPSSVPPFLSPHFKSSGDLYEDWLLR